MTRGTSMRAVPVAVAVALAVGWTALGTGVSGAARTGAGFTVTSTAAAVHGGAAHPGAGRPYGARLLSCRRSPQIAARIASVAAMMRPVDGATHLALRIALYQRPLGAGRWTLRADVPGLGAWTSPSDPSIGSRSADVFQYRQAVGRLVVPYAYRFHVDFRWLDDAGKVVRQAHATTASCREPDLRPDLVLARVIVSPELRATNRARYVVTVRNDGRSAARHVALAASFPSDPTASRARSLGRLRPGQATVITFLGPTCSTVPAPPSFTVDPANAIEESRETNNQLAAVCPEP